MTVNELKVEAIRTANEYDINWDKLNDLKYRHDFVTSIEMALAELPTIETLYEKLISGKSVVTPDEDTSLPLDELEEYQMVVAEELAEAYVLQEILHKFNMVEAVIKADRESM